MVDRTSENRGADLFKTCSAQEGGWHRLRSMRQEKLRNHLNHPSPALRRFQKDAPLFSGFIRPEVRTSKCRISKAERKGKFIDKTELLSAGKY